MISRDKLVGLIFFIFSTLFLASADFNNIGTFSNPGPYFFPVTLAIILLILLLIKLLNSTSLLITVDIDDVYLLIKIILIIIVFVFINDYIDFLLATIWLISTVVLVVDTKNIKTIFKSNLIVLLVLSILIYILGLQINL